METTKSLELKSNTQQEQMQSMKSIWIEVKGSLSTILTSLKEKWGICLWSLKWVNFIKIEHKSIPIMLKDRNEFSVYSFCDVWCDTKIWIIDNDKKINNEKNHKTRSVEMKTENETRIVKLWNTDNDVKESKEIENEVFWIIKSIDIKSCKNKLFLTTVQAWIDGDWINDPADRKALADIVGIYELYWKKEIVIKTLFDMPIFSGKFHMFLGKVHERAKKLDNPYWAFQNAKKYLKTGGRKKSERLSDLLLLYSITPNELWLDDVPKTPFINWWTCTWK
jgi:hypothetical protein